MPGHETIVLFRWGWGIIEDLSILCKSATARKRGKESPRENCSPLFSTDRQADTLRMTRVACRLGFRQLLLGFSLLIEPLLGYNVLMATMGGTKSHTVPFVALGTSLRSRGHNVTLLSAFPGPAANNGLHELVPSILEVIYDLPCTSVSPGSGRIPSPFADFLTASRHFFLSSNLVLDPYLILLRTE